MALLIAGWLALWFGSIISTTAAQDANSTYPEGFTFFPNNTLGSDANLVSDGCVSAMAVRALHVQAAVHLNSTSIELQDRFD